jgi:hypothetical protein
MLGFHKGIQVTPYYRFIHGVPYNDLLQHGVENGRQSQKSKHPHRQNNSGRLSDRIAHGVCENPPRLTSRPVEKIEWHMEKKDLPPFSLPFHLIL